uniref:Uncharacterized protein n=1 Tax=Ditylenchus dipsaci TaxID=166011 RepID=A0A915ED45_9BILA
MQRNKCASVRLLFLINGLLEDLNEQNPRIDKFLEAQQRMEKAIDMRSFFDWNTTATFLDARFKDRLSEDRTRFRQQVTSWIEQEAEDLIVDTGEHLLHFFIRNVWILDSVEPPEKMSRPSFFDSLGIYDASVTKRPSTQLQLEINAYVLEECQQPDVDCMEYGRKIRFLIMKSLANVVSNDLYVYRHVPREDILPIGQAATILFGRYTGFIRCAIWVACSSLLLVMSEYYDKCHTDAYRSIIVFTVTLACSYVTPRLPDLPVPPNVNELLFLRATVGFFIIVIGCVLIGCVEMKTTNAEMKTANAEMKTANAEMKTANAVMKTANAEMQSKIDQMQDRINELDLRRHQCHIDMKNGGFADGIKAPFISEGDFIKNNRSV